MSPIEAEKLFIEAVASCDGDLMRTALDAVAETGAQAGTLAHLKHMSPQGDISKSFRAFWSEHGWTIRERFEDDYGLIDALHNLISKYKGPDMTLYRGEVGSSYAQGRIGISWTSDLSVAQPLARGLNRLPPDGGVVLEAFVPAVAIICSPEGWKDHLQEREYIVDSRLLGEVRQLDRYSA